MYAVRLESSYPTITAYLFRWGSFWGRAEHLVRVFSHQSEAEKALSEAKREAAALPEWKRSPGLVERLERAEIVMVHDLPEKTSSGVPFRLQTSNEQVMY